MQPLSWPEQVSVPLAGLDSQFGRGGVSPLCVCAKAARTPRVLLGHTPGKEEGSQIHPKRHWALCPHPHPMGILRSRWA